MKKIYFIIFIIVFVVVLGLGAVMYWYIAGVMPKNTGVPSGSDYGTSYITPLAHQGATTSWQIYKNKLFGYSIAYPSDWTLREFPDTQTGAGLRPFNSPNDVASECITVDERSAPASDYMVPLDAYAKIAGRMEIQGYDTIHTIQSVTTTDGLVGYETTWLYKTVTGQENISLPITYIENNKTIQTSNGLMKYKTLQIILNSGDCKEVYDHMLSTVKLLP